MTVLLARVAVILAIVMVACPCLPSRASTRVCDEAYIHRNGVVFFQGHLLRSPAKLKERLTEYRQRSPDCIVDLVFPKQPDMQRLGPVLLVFVQTGALGPGGVLIMPRTSAN